MSGDGIRGLLNLAGSSVMAPDMLSEAWSSFPEADRAALERITKVLEDLTYSPNEEFAIFAHDAVELCVQNVLSHLGMRDLVSFRNFLKLMVRQHWISEASLVEKPVSGDSQPQLSLNVRIKS